MNIPRQVKIGNIVYKIKYLDCFIDDGDTIGVIKFSQGLIVLTTCFKGKKLDKSNIIESLMHELFHALDFFYLGDILTEDEIDLLSKSWVQVISENNINFKDIKHIPDKIRILGATHTIEFPYAPVEATDPGAVLYYSFSERNIKIVNSIFTGELLSDEFIKKYLIDAINEILIPRLRLNRMLELDEVGKGYILRVLSFSIFNMFRDNPVLEPLIKEGCS